MFLAGVLLFGGTGGAGIGDIGYILEEIALDQGELNVDIECPVAVVTVQEISVDVASIEVL
jgi:hypothetical protein